MPPEQRADRAALAACSCMQAAAAAAVAPDAGPPQPGSAASAAHNNPTPTISSLTVVVDRMPVSAKQVRCLESPGTPVLEIDQRACR